MHACVCMYVISSWRQHSALSSVLWLRTRSSNYSYTATWLGRADGHVTLWMSITLSCSVATVFVASFYSWPLPDCMRPHCCSSASSRVRICHRSRICHNVTYVWFPCPWWVCRCPAHNLVPLSIRQYHHKSRQFWYRPSPEIDRYVLFVRPYTVTPVWRWSSCCERDRRMPCWRHWMRRIWSSRYSGLVGCCVLWAARRYMIWFANSSLLVALSLEAAFFHRCLCLCSYSALHGVLLATCYLLFYFLFSFLCLFT